MSEPIASECVEDRAETGARRGAGKGARAREAGGSKPGGRDPSAPPQQPASRQTLYRTRDVGQILGISRRQLQYWAQTDLVAPSQRTRGGHHRYSFEDLVALKAAKRLIDAGVSVQRIRKAIRSLRKTLPTIEKPLADLVLVATGDVVLAFVEGTAFEAISGQEWVFEVAQFQREIETWNRNSHSEEKGKQRIAIEPVQKARSVRRAREQSRTA